MNLTKRGWHLLLHLAGAATLAAFSIAVCPHAPANAGYWVATWGAAPLRNALPDSITRINTVNTQTLRERVRISVGGNQVRIRLSNEFGTHSLRIGAASLALPASGSAIKPGSLKPITFGGSTSIVISPGAPVLSDPVDLHVAPLSELTISLFLPDKTAIETVHYTNTASNGVVSKEGDFTRQESMPILHDTIARAFLTEIDVLATEPTRVLVTLGDSITDGFNPDTGGYISWPDRLVDRVIAGKDNKLHVSVVNAGANGNFLLRNDDGWGSQSALARFDRDVLAVSGVTHIIVLEGTNDIIEPEARDHQSTEHEPFPTAEGIIAGYKQLIGRAHAHGLRIYGATLIPFEAKKTTDIGYFSPAKEDLRTTINEWIRSSGAFDGVIDFDKALRNPQEFSRVVRAYLSSDDLHPSAAGYRAMAEAVDLSLFQ